MSALANQYRELAQKGAFPMPPPLHCLMFG